MNDAKWGPMRKISPAVNGSQNDYDSLVDLGNVDKNVVLKNFGKNHLSIWDKNYPSGLAA